MRSLIRLVAAIAAALMGLAVISLGRNVQAMGLGWSGGYYNLGNMREFLILVGVLWLGGGLIVVFAFLGLLAAALGLRRRTGGRKLAVAAAIGIALGLALVAGALILRPDHGSERFLTIWLAAGGTIVVLFILTALGGEKRPQPKPEVRRVAPQAGGVPTSQG